jgi:transcriptional regulator with XRE-family HTH domain
MPTNLKNHIGSMIRLTRQEAGLTQEQLAARIDKAVETISNIERGHTMTGLETLEKLSGVLGIPLVRFFEDYDGERVVPRNRLEREQALRELSRRLCDRDLHVVTELTKVLIDSQADG